LPGVSPSSLADSGVGPGAGGRGAAGPVAAIKFAGAAYFIYVGIQVIRQCGGSPTAATPRVGRPPWLILWEESIVGATRAWHDVGPGPAPTSRWATKPSHLGTIAHCFAP
jgi:hypothetical protein